MGYVLHETAARAGAALGNEMGRQIQRALFTSRTRVAAFSTLFVLGLGGAAYAIHLAVDTDGHTTLEQVLTESSDPNYKTLSVQQVNEDYIVRAPAVAPPQSGRETRRRSLAYFAQLTDFQLADEESPARVEFADPGASSAWRPQEAFHPYVIDASIRQINRFVPSSVVPQGNGMGNAMDFALMTGDQADNAQRNEFRWTRELIEGGTSLNFNSGVTEPAFYSSPAFLSKPSCPAYLASEGGSAANAAAEAALYTGVQDYDDYPAAAPPGPQPAYYDPDQPLGQYADWPLYPGLMDRAQTAFTPAGLLVPSYWSNGNHDVLVQGNEDGTAPIEDIATACFKALGTTLQIPPSSPGPDFVPDPNLLLAPTAAGMLVPPDPERRFLDRPQIKQVLGADGEDDSHGFDFVDPAEETASNGNASYYSWDPPQTPGFRFINIDTNSEGGQTAEGVASGSSNGNIDDPQFQWLTSELDAAQAADKLIVLYGHHPVRSMNTEIADEQALPCTVNDTHGDTPEHDVNPGCDRDPRVSTPMHLGTDPVAGDPRESFVELLDDYPNVVAYVAGHTHEHRLIPFTRTDQSVWWEINSSATADWPQQHRLIEVMDNRDDTLSIFGTVLDAASPAQQPPEGSAAAFDPGQLASIGRTLSFNDPDNNQSGEGTPDDRNVEMLLDDPREADVSVTKADTGFDPVVAGSSITYDIDVTNNDPTTTATLVRLADLLPPTVTYTSATPTQGTCTPPVDGTLNCALGDLAPGQTVSVSVVVSPQTIGTITNRATVSSVTDDPNPDNNVDTEQTTVTPTPGVSADLSIAKQAPSSVTLGNHVTYTLTVANDGPDTVNGVATTDTLPNGAGLINANASQGTCSNAGDVVTCAIGTMASGETETVTIVAQAQLVRTLVNTASVSSGATDPDGSDNSATASTVVNAQPSTSPGTVPGPGTPAAARAHCRGLNTTITGTKGADTITGTAGRDVIASGAGSDKIRARGGNDVICGFAGRDRLFGGPGRDILLGGDGNDLIAGGKGRDRVRGGKGRDRCPKRERCGVK